MACGGGDGTGHLPGIQYLRWTLNQKLVLKNNHCTQNKKLPLGTHLNQVVGPRHPQAFTPLFWLAWWRHLRLVLSRTFIRSEENNCGFPLRGHNDYRACVQQISRPGDFLYQPPPAFIRDLYLDNLLPGCLPAIFMWAAARGSINMYFCSSIRCISCQFVGYWIVFLQVTAREREK